MKLREALIETGYAKLEQPGFVTTYVELIDDGIRDFRSFRSNEKVFLVIEEETSSDWEPIYELTEDEARNLSSTEVYAISLESGWIPSEKLRYDLIPVEAERERVRAFMNGAKKYAPWDWLTKPTTYSDQYAAIRRHLESYRSGEKIDPDSGLYHLALASARIDILLTYELKGVGEDDLTKEV